jgi:hypothetical protein
MWGKRVAQPRNGLTIYQNIRGTGNNRCGGKPLVVHTRITKQNYRFAHNLRPFIVGLLIYP